MVDTVDKETRSRIMRRVRSKDTLAWRNALKQAGIKNFRWHDLRHTWASWLVQNGTPLYVLQEMGGWQSAEMVRRYAHLAPANLVSHAQLVDNILNNVTSTPQLRVIDGGKKG